MAKLVVLQIFFLLLILPRFALSSVKESTTFHGIKVKAVPPVYSVEIKDVTLYEATIPIFFHIQLPKIPEEFPPHRDHLFQHHRNCTRGVDSSRNESSATREYSQYHCALERQFILASNHIVKDLQQMQKMQLLSKHEPTLDGKTSSTTSTPSRKKRQAAPVLVASSLLAGFLLRPAINKFTGNLFGSNEEWTEHFNSIRESLIKEHELLIDFEQSTEAYTQEMSDILTTMSLLLSEQKRDLIWTLRLLSTKMHADLIQDAIHSCKTKHLPGNLIKPDFLRKTLSALDKNLSSSLNYTLAINSDDVELGKYYKLPIADCMFTDDKAHITLNVPLKRNKAQWKLHDIIHSKYAFHNQVCELYPQEVAYLAEEVGTESRSVLITNHMLKYCSIHEHQLCMIPQFGKDSVQSLTCTLLAAKVKDTSNLSKKVEALLKSCSFRCYSNDEVIITQVDHEKIVVTNAETLTYQCGGESENQEKTIQVGRLGAVEINLKCDCWVKINGEIRLATPLPCSYSSTEDRRQQSSGHDMFSFTVPFQWAHNLSQILEEEENLFIDHHEKLAAHVNHKWSRLIPVLNFTKEHEQKIQNFTVPEKVDVQFSSISTTTVQVWLLILTVAVLLHIVLTFYCCFKLFFLRFREYELPPTYYREKERECDGWFIRQKRSSEQSHHTHHQNQNHNRNNSNQSSSSSGKSNRRHNFEVYQEMNGKHAKHDDNHTSNDCTTTSMIQNQEDTYRSNRNSVVNKLI